MIRQDVMRRLAGVLVVALAVAGSGCAGKMAYRQGLEEAKKGEWDMAVARLTRALQKDPDNIGYKIALENARINASRMHTATAKKHLAADDLEKAAESLEIASKYDPSNRIASDDLEVVNARLKARAAERERLANFDATQAAVARPVLPVLSPRSPKPILLKWADQSLQKLFETLGRLAGVNILFDGDFRDKNVTVNLNNVTFQEALDQLTFINRLFYKVVDQNTLIVVPESAAKRRTYDESLLRTFYLQNAEIKEMEAILKATLGSGPKIASNPTLGAITVVGTADQLALAQRLLELNDKARGEVMVEVEIMEVNRNRVRRYGIELSNYSAQVVLAPTQDPEGTSLTNVRAHFLSSLNLSDFVVRIPNSVLTRFLNNEDSVRLIASPRLRAAEGKKTTLKIVQKVPVPQTTIQFGNNTGSGTFPQTTIAYQDVGVTLEITPKVSAAGEITLEVNVEFSLQGEDRNVGTDSNPLSVPIFSTRSVNGILRLRDGETSLIGGLVQGREAETLSGVLGLSKIPVINKLFNVSRREKNDQEIVISITPHLVRAPKITAQDLASLNIGTPEMIRVQSARPPLFGATPEEVTAPAAPASSMTPPPAAGARSQAPAPVRPVVGTPDGMGEEERDPMGGARAVGPTDAVMGAGSGPIGARVSLTPVVSTVRAGETTSLGVVLVGGQDISAAELIVSFDASVLEPLDVTAGPLLTLDGTTVGVEKNLEPGRVRARFSRNTPTGGSGVIATMVFRALRNGTSPVRVEALSLSTRTGTVVPPGGGSAQVSVQ